MDTSKLITLGAVGIGLYILYEFLISQCETPSSALFGGTTCGMLLGTPAGLTTPTVGAPVQNLVPATPSTASTVQVQVQPATAVTLADLLTQAAITAGENPSNLTPDQWSFYYQQTPGKPAISAALFESILGSLGLTDATRATVVSASTFASALVSNGLSGLGFHNPNSMSWVPAQMIHGGIFG